MSQDVDSGGDLAEVLLFVSQRVGERHRTLVGNNGPLVDKIKDGVPAMHAHLLGVEVQDGSRILEHGATWVVPF